MRVFDFFMNYKYVLETFRYNTFQQYNHYKIIISA